MPSRETGEAPVKVCRYLGERGVIDHVHFRNVIVRKPSLDYTEVFLDEGRVEMFAVMKELVRQKYPRGLDPEHPRALDTDRERGIRNQYAGGAGTMGQICNVAYAKAVATRLRCRRSARFLPDSGRVGGVSGAR